AGAWAADPFVGTWSLNASKTKYKTGQPAKEQTVTIQQEGDNYTVTIKGVAANDTPFSARYTIPIRSGKGTVEESTAYDAVSTKRLDAMRRENTYFKAGKQMMTIRTRVSKDGKMLTVNVKGTDALGKPVDGVAVYDKQ
ncbi:MAG: hypothetical protein HYZ57_20795, partial [Acidobacteria bacterium]|nr:hypothetical protein [Acidobacteriota bacterium]